MTIDLPTREDARRHQRMLAADVALDNHLESDEVDSFIPPAYCNGFTAGHMIASEERETVEAALAEARATADSVALTSRRLALSDAYMALTADAGTADDHNRIRTILTALAGDAGLPGLPPAQLKCSWCMRPALGMARSIEDAQTNPSCGRRDCGVGFRAGVGS